MKVAFQIGFRKARGRQREGQLIKISINDVECSWTDGVNDGRWITSPASGALGNSWYLYMREVFNGDTIHVEVKTALAGLGADERRTFEAFYTVSEDFPVRELAVPNVGMKGVPLIKGRIKELGSVSKEDERMAEVTALLDEGNF